VLRPKTGGITIVASGRSDWIGWVDLKRETVNETALRMTAQVVADVSANVLAVVEAEDRLALGRFDQQLLEPLGAAHDHIMLIDGNDERGIDVGLMTRGVSITSVVSHVDDVDGNQRIFSRDCPEYFLNANGQEVVVLVNHFKSKGYGSTASSNARRLAQSRRVRDIYDQRRNEGYDLIAIIGDLNDTPTSTSLTPLMTTDLRDISTLPVFVPDVPNRPGTYGNGTASQKIDYILLSPALAILATHASVNRMGVWGGKNGNLFPHYPEMTREIHAASDHAALYVDINL
jgi:endonuclease/exonuclease/phosphatase family metal-dependent hydrolase